MSHKRQHGEGGSSFQEKHRRKVPSFKSVVLDVMSLQRLQNLVQPVLEPLIRRVVKEEMDMALRKYTLDTDRTGGKDVHPSESRTLKLKFLNAISLPVFTGTRIEGEGCTTLKVALVDVLTEQVVSDELESSAKVEILVLEGDFDTKDDNWKPEEFTNNIVRERAGKKPLLTGDVIMSLKGGIGVVENVLFTDNSSWTRSRKFRLGVRLLENHEVRIREARSDAFVVRDHRGELYKKHHPPSLSDEVWRLEKIGKDGAFHKRLAKERVYTVQDFLVFLFLNPSRLRHILGPGMSTKMWEVMADHARTCIVGDKLYFYDRLRTPQKNGVVFNAVGQVKGMFSNDQYVPIEKLSEAEKSNAHGLVISAYGDRQNVMAFDDDSILGLPTSLNAQSCSELQSQASQHQDPSTRKIERFPFSQLEAATPSYMQYGLDDYFPSFDLMDLAYDQPLNYSQVPEICDTGSVTRAFSANGHLEFFESEDFSGDLQNVTKSYIPLPEDHIVSPPKQKWNILVIVLKWRFLIKRIVKRTRGRDIPDYC